MPEPSQKLATKVAQNVLAKTLQVKKGDNVIIETWSESLPWAKPFVSEARKMGANPLLLYEDEEAFWEAVESGRAQDTGRVGDHEWSALDETAAYVFFFGPSSWPRLDDIPEKKKKGLASYNGEWYKRAAKAKVRGARMYLGRTSPLAAERWKLDLKRWQDELLRASLVPPEQMHRLGNRIAERLKRGKTVTITHDNGTELSFQLGKFPIQLDDALVDASDIKSGYNMATIPGGVVGVAIDHNSSEGMALGNHTCYPNSGPVEAPQWTFEGGRLTDLEYGSGGAPIKAEYAKAPKGKDRLGFFSIGLNPKLTMSPQMEDQELGAVLLHLGGNNFRGGKNACPWGTWMVLKGASVDLDGRPILTNGRIVA